jgi:hypothetical protein
MKFEKPTREIIANITVEDQDRILHLQRGEKLGIAYFKVRKPGSYMVFLKLKGFIIHFLDSEEKYKGILWSKIYPQ